MVFKRTCTWALAVLAILIGFVLSSCSFGSSAAVTGAGGIPEWQFRWLPKDGNTDASVGPQAAFASAGWAEHIQEGSTTDHKPAAVVWLATGRTFGEAVVQLDPAGRYWNLVTLLLDASGHAWQALAGDLPQPAPCGNGTQFSGQAAIFGAYCTLEPVRSNSSPAISISLWTTPQSQTFITARIAATAERPADSIAMHLTADETGWVLHDKGWTVVLALLPGGESVIVASTVDSQRCQELAIAFLGLGADPSSLR